MAHINPKVVSLGKALDTGTREARELRQYLPFARSGLGGLEFRV